MCGERMEDETAAGRRQAGETLPSLETWDRKFPFAPARVTAAAVAAQAPHSPILQEVVRASRQGLGLIKSPTRT